MNRINIICGNRSERFPRLIDEITKQGITDYELWDGIYLPHSVRESINASHKMIVEYAKLAEWGSVIIAEDDLKFTHEKSWQHFLKSRPDVFDIYLSMIYMGDIENGRVSSFTGMTLYEVSSKYYDRFLQADSHEHIDQALSKTGGDFHVCYPFAAIQYNGWSSNTGKDEVYDTLLTGRELYNG